MQRGFSLTEMLLACAIAAVLLLLAMPPLSGTKPAAAASSALAVDAAVSKAQSIAATSGNGATLQFSAVTNGTAIRVYSGRPNGVSAMTQAAPDTNTFATIAESSLGAAPFAVFFDSSGHASAMSGMVDPAAAIASDPGCPAAGAVTLLISDPRDRVQRTLPCAH
ncbi:MAG TPA: prepilin-type N-terminal cleavage/methylation domain-containing protein [Candidatus Baltobacteraceae bacterium]|nr:prepilin-type N-terminal cleavage/methylation domain-containing protein [Candidatus Baltobacteraceae bacterium]